MSHGSLVNVVISFSKRAENKRLRNVNAGVDVELHQKSFDGLFNKELSVTCMVGFSTVRSFKITEQYTLCTFHTYFVQHLL